MGCIKENIGNTPSVFFRINIKINILRSLGELITAEETAGRGRGGGKLPYKNNGGDHDTF